MLPFLCRGAGASTLSQWMFRALKGAQQLNPGVDMYDSSGPELLLPDGSTVCIKTHTEQHQLYWKLSGCNPGHRHFRRCTAKALATVASLFCPFCNYDEQLWRAHGKALMPACEAEFIQLLLRRGLDGDYCHQVVPQFWPSPADFYNMCAHFYVQVDGKCHWSGMHKLSSMEVIARDMSFNLAALAADACVVRVHEADVGNDVVVLAALAATAYGSCIILTPSYNTAIISYEGQKQPYIKVLQGLAPEYNTYMDSYGNCILCKR